MAKGKKTFIFYSDWINMIQEMPDKDAGELLKHVLSYVNDESPETKNILVKMAFGHMKPLIKSDLEKWEDKKRKFSEMGKASAQARKKKRESKKDEHNSTYVEPTLTKVKPASTVNVNVNDNVNVNVNDTVNDNENNSLKKNQKENLIFPFESEEFKTTWSLWLEYRRQQHQFKYKGTISEQAALKGLAEKSNQDEKTAIQIIHQSIENSYKGFFPLKNNRNDTGNSKSNFSRNNNFTEEGFSKIIDGTYGQ